MAASQSDGFLATAILFAAGAPADGDTPAEGIAPVDAVPDFAASSGGALTGAVASAATAFSAEARSLRPGAGSAAGAASAFRSALGDGAANSMGAAGRALASFACGATGDPPAGEFAMGGDSLTEPEAGACCGSGLSVTDEPSGGLRSTISANMATSTAEKASCSGSAKRNHQGFGFRAGATLSLAAFRIAWSSAAGGSSAALSRYSFLTS